MKCKARLSYTYHLARVGFFLTFCRQSKWPPLHCQQLTVKGRDESALLVTSLLEGSLELLYSKTTKDESASLLLNWFAQIHVEILLPGL